MRNEINYSVIIPFRDSLEQLKIALESIPERNDIQIITVDNSKVLFDHKQYPSRNQPFEKLSSKYGAGAGCARNVGLQYAQGSHLLFLDADDYFTANAFNVFDRYIYTDYDIVYFKADSINLTTGQKSRRHETICKRIDCYFETKNEDYLRYQFGNPVCKLVKTDLVRNHRITFEEVKCSNDVMFSVISGHNAKSVTADNAQVYMITEAPAGVSLMTNKSAENSFIRYQVAIRKYAFLKSIGRPDIKPKFISYIGNALVSFGVKEALKYIMYYCKNRP